MALNRNLYVPCGCDRKVISGPNRKSLPAPTDTSAAASAFSRYCCPHAQPLRTYIDRDLMSYQEVWAAGGTPQALFALTPQQLVELTQGDVVEVKA